VHCPLVPTRITLLVIELRRASISRRVGSGGAEDPSNFFSVACFYRYGVLGREGYAQKGSSTCVTTWQRDPQLGSGVSVLSWQFLPFYAWRRHFKFQRQPRIRMILRDAWPALAICKGPSHSSPRERTSGLRLLRTVP